jgi:4-amino-4-deoxy-L-arabinose transferase-like glycosyltransferase
MISEEHESGCTSTTARAFAPEAAPARAASWLRVLSAPITRRALATLVWIGAGVVAARLALDAGITWDEPVQREYGDLILDWFRSGFHDRSALKFENLYFYGGLFDAPAQWLISLDLSPWGVYETRHVLTALLAVAGIGASYGIAARIAGARAGFAAALMLALTPAWIGHGMFNPKDIPFGAAAALVAYVSVRIALRPPPLRWSDALLTGVSAGLALGVRSGGMFILGFPLLAALGRVAWSMFVLARRHEPARTRALLGTTALRFASALPLAWLLMIAAWPWAQRRPLTRPFRAAAEAAHFHWSGPVLFQGISYQAEDLPRSYLPVWFGLTLPELYVVAAVSCGLCLCWRARRWQLERAWALTVLCLFVLVPVAGVLITHPTLYDAHRHFLFLLPPLAALGGVAVARALENRALPALLRAGIAGAFLVCAAQVASDMVHLHPYEYLYFNRLSGGLAAQVGRYETDYWGASYREGLAWVRDNITGSRHGRKRVTVSGCYGSRDPLEYYIDEWPEMHERFAHTGRESRAEIFLGITRDDCHHARGRVIHKVSRMGAPLLYVLQR